MLDQFDTSYTHFMSCLYEICEEIDISDFFEKAIGNLHEDINQLNSFKTNNSCY